MQLVQHPKTTTNTDSLAKSPHKCVCSINAEYKQFRHSDCASMRRSDRSRWTFVISYWSHASLRDISIASATMQPGVNQLRLRLSISFSVFHHFLSLSTQDD
jgi:hypothetical protein